MTVYNQLKELRIQNTTFPLLKIDECDEIILIYIYLLFFEPSKIPSKFRNFFQNWVDVYNEYVSPAHILNLKNARFKSEALKAVNWGKISDFLSKRYEWKISNDHITDSNKVITLEIFDLFLYRLLKKKSPSVKGKIYTPYNYAYFIVEKGIIHWFRAHFPGELPNTIHELKNSIERMEPTKRVKCKQLIEKIKILDPSVGTGVFLLAAADILLDLRSNAQDKAFLDIIRTEITENNLYGIDIDNIALKTAKMKLNLWASPNSSINIINYQNRYSKIYLGNTLLGFQYIPDNTNKNDCQLLDQQYDNFIQKKFPIYRLSRLNDINKFLEYLSSIPISFFLNPNFKYFILEGNRTQWNDQKNNLNESLKKKIIYSVSNESNSKFQVYAVFSNPLDSNSSECTSINQIKIETLSPPNKFHWSSMGFSKRNKFDLIVGNPPFIPLTDLSFINRKMLQINYSEIYSGNNDLSYFFIHRSLEALQEKIGILAFIVPKYLLQSAYANKIRQKISEQTNIVEIRDISNFLIFQNTSIRNVILFLKVGIPSLEYKLNFIKYEQTDDLISKKNLVIDQLNLDSDKWVFLSVPKLKLLQRIEKSSEYKLEDVANISKGIETGCDRVFAPSEKYFFSKTLAVSKEQIKKWIKGKDIKKYKVIETGQEVLYAPFFREKQIRSDKKLMKYLNKNKSKLLNRSRISVFYTWRIGDERYTMNWNSPKIVTPYKSIRSRFAIDFNGCLSSKDVTWIILKEDYRKKHDFLFYLVGLLNSDIMNFYSISTIKDLGNIFEYYPKQIKKFPIKIIEEESITYKSICELVKNLFNESSEFQRKQYQKELDHHFYQLYNLLPNEIELIKDTLENRKC